jgi:F0F1-type ATP synthase assembly protein I
MKDPKKTDDLKRSLKTYSKYSALGLQMGALIFIGAYGGKWLDSYFEFQKPWLTMIGTLSGMGSGLYILLNGLKTDDND